MIINIEQSDLIQEHLFSRTLVENTSMSVNMSLPMHSMSDNMALPYIPHMLTWHSPHILCLLTWHSPHILNVNMALPTYPMSENMVLHIHSTPVNMGHSTCSTYVNMALPTHSTSVCMVLPTHPTLESQSLESLLRLTLDLMLGLSVSHHPTASRLHFMPLVFRVCPFHHLSPLSSTLPMGILPGGFSMKYTADTPAWHVKG